MAASRTLNRAVGLCSGLLLVFCLVFNVEMIRPFCGLQPTAISTVVPRLTFNLSSELSSESHNRIREPKNTEPPFHWNQTMNSEKCFYVEDICHSSHRWFYRTNPGKKQPRILLQMHSGEVSDQETAYSKEYRFEHAGEGAINQCPTSPITNHLVVFSHFNEMLGEFYDRGLLFLWLLSREFDWVTTAQQYIHVYMPNRRTLDSHHLFTGPFRTHPLLDFTTLLDETPCTCLPRLILCGYEAKPSQNESDVTVLEPGLDVLMFTRQYFDENVHRDLRNYLWDNLIRNNAHVQHDIQAYRHRLFRRHNITSSEQSEWRIVGLAQRVLRRRWRNLDEIIGPAQELVNPHKLLLTEMNVETKISSSYRQLIMHGAMDALVGIHGAQLTEGVWMKRGSWVVELLPYVPDGIWAGEWTKVTDKPTGLGVLFDNTELNHAGYPLRREHAPYCYEESKDDPLDCWRTWNFPWDVRDFVLEPHTLANILNATMVGTFGTCQDYRDKVGDEMVLYNVNCAEDSNAPIVPHHFYWNSTSEEA